MLEDKPEDIGYIKKLFYEYLKKYGNIKRLDEEGRKNPFIGIGRFAALKEYWDEFSKIYDSHEEKTLGETVDDCLFWEILESHLPKERDARILDAGGGTGRCTLPLLKMGYKVTLSDFSSGMLEVARKKLVKENLVDRVEIEEANIMNLPFAGESFDFVLCVGGVISCAYPTRAASELARVLKKKRKIFVDAINRYYVGLHGFGGNPQEALQMVKSGHPVFLSPKEFEKLFQSKGIEISHLYGYGGGGPSGLGILDLLPSEIIKARKWNDETFSRLMELMRHLSKEPSIIGLAGSLILVGEKI
jgi:SAM-dependent methyltransferase